MTVVDVAAIAGEFAENKEAAKSVRERTLLPALRRGDEVVLDFSGVNLATQSFVHALVSALIRDENLSALDHLVFKGCNRGVKAVVSIVVDYSQELVADDDSESPGTAPPDT
jgi:hypothetical protein